MALTIPCDSAKVATMDEYLEYVRKKVRFADLDSIIASAPMLRSLANNRAMVLERMNSAVEANFSGHYLRSAQAFELARDKDFFVRAAIWPPASSVATGRIYQEQFSYNVAHDHNFSFLTANNLGPGYDTDLYEYDYEKAVGYVGELIDLRFIEKKRFGPGTVMLYRASKDVHIQHPPPELTITLNLIWAPTEVRVRDQFTFDVDRKTISGYVGGGEADKRLSLLRMAGILGDDQTRGLLDQISQTHPCRRTRLAAYSEMIRLSPGETEAIWRRATADPSAMVVREAKLQLERLAT